MNNLNPSNEKFREISAENTHASLTQWNNYDFITKVKARSPESTFIISDSFSSWISSISRQRFNEIATLQEQYLHQIGYFTIIGSISNNKLSQAGIEFRIGKNHPNIAAMQQQLLFPMDQGLKTDFHVVQTPGLEIEGFPGKKGILIDLERYITRIFGTDYFGESKKAGLRMWNKYIYDKGGLAFHAGCKSFIDKDGKDHSILIIGLSGTGKTTTTFTSHANSEPIQDDFCALFPSGKIFASENGCFAKTYQLDPKDEPLIYHGITHRNAWLENVYIDSEGFVDFSNDVHTTNGRGTFPLQLIPHGDINHIPPLSKILILNKDFNIIPAIARLNQSQAAAYFMLGETMGTSAGGKSEAGKALRVPGTNPFFPLDHALQANRFFELLKTSPGVEVYLLNTGHIGKDASMQGGEKITIEHSRMIIEALLHDELEWETDPDFGYEIVKASQSPIERIFTNPRFYYEKNNRLSEYTQILKRVKRNRLAFLEPYKNLNKELLFVI